MSWAKKSDVDKLESALNLEDTKNRSLCHCHSVVL